MICSEVNRIVKSGGIICTPRPLSDNLLTPPGDKTGHGHKWWWSVNHTSPGFLTYMKRLDLLRTTMSLKQHVKMMAFFRPSWEQCVIFKKPLGCKQISHTLFPTDVGKEKVIGYRSHWNTSKDPVSGESWKLHWSNVGGSEVYDVEWRGENSNDRELHT